MQATSKLGAVRAEATTKNALSLGRCGGELEMRVCAPLQVSSVRHHASRWQNEAVRVKVTGANACGFGIEPR
eukprot:4301250-Pyramimonas_sp.AAC.1